MFGLCTKKACILVDIITLLLPLLYDIRVDAAPGPHGIMYQYRPRIGSNTYTDKKTDLIICPMLWYSNGTDNNNN